MLKDLAAALTTSGITEIRARYLVVGRDWIDGHRPYSESVLFLDDVWLQLKRSLMLRPMHARSLVGAK
jgi:hypothetical protein